MTQHQLDHCQSNAALVAAGARAPFADRALLAMPY